MKFPTHLAHPANGGGNTGNMSRNYWGVSYFDGNGTWKGTGYNSAPYVPYDRWTAESAAKKLRGELRKTEKKRKKQKK